MLNTCDSNAAESLRTCPWLCTPFRSLPHGGCPCWHNALRGATPPCDSMEKPLKRHSWCWDVWAPSCSGASCIFNVDASMSLCLSLIDDIAKKTRSWKTLTPLYLRHRSIQLETSYDIITLWQYRGPLKNWNVQRASLRWNNKLQRSWVTREWTILSTGFDMRTCQGRQLPGQECKYACTK